MPHRYLDDSSNVSKSHDILATHCIDTHQQPGYTTLVDHLHCVNCVRNVSCSTREHVVGQLFAVNRITTMSSAVAAVVIANLQTTRLD